jgi:hypothetical protein
MIITQAISHKDSLFVLNDAGQLFQLVPLMVRTEEINADERTETPASELSKKELESSHWSFDRYIWQPVTQEILGEIQERPTDRPLRREIPDRT